MKETMKGKTLVKGHALFFEGKPWDTPRSTGEGKAKCTCGVFSPSLPNNSQRQKWHREHKEKIREAQA